MRAFETAASWLELGPPEARALGEEILALLDVFDEEELVEIADAMASGGWEASRW